MSTYQVVAETTYEGKGAADVKHDYSWLDTFNLVMLIDRKTGELLDVRINYPTQGIDPELISKLFTFITATGSSIAPHVLEGDVKEIDLIFDNKLVVIINDGEKLRVGISSNA